MFAETFIQYHHWTGVDGGMGAWGWLPMLVMMLLWIALLAVAVAAIYWLLKKATDDTRGDAESILRERYARGEIDEDEYRERMDNLSR